MHPDDHKAFVATEVAELQRRLREQPRAHVTGVRLSDGSLMITTRVNRHQRLTAGVGVGLLAGSNPKGGTGFVRRLTAPRIGSGVAQRVTLALDLAGFNRLPPSARLLGGDGELLPAADWPRGGGRDGLVVDHPEHNRPFICRIGLREYHDLPQHADHPWESYREGLRLADIALGIVDDLLGRWSYRQ